MHSSCKQITIIKLIYKINFWILI